MKNGKLVGLLVILFISPLMALKDNSSVDNPGFLNLLGKYKSSFYCDEKVTELTYEEANKFLGKTLVLNKNSLILFRDTLRNVTYNQDKVNTNDYLAVYKPSACFRRMVSLFGDSISILTAKTPENDSNPPIDVIITDRYLVANYRGYFYFFDRKIQTQKPSKSKGTK